MIRRTTSLSLFFLILLLTGWMIGSCARQEKPYIVRVGDEVLTEALLDSLLPEDARPIEARRNQFIQQWVHTSLLFQKARKEGFERDLRYRRHLAEIQRELLIQLYLDDEYDRNIKILPQEIDEYYRKHIDEFKSIEEHIQAEYFATKDRKRALEMARQFRSLSRLRKKDFLDLIQQNLTPDDIVGTTELLPRSRFDPRSGKQLFAPSATDDIIGPLPFGKDYYVIWHILEIRPKGTPQSFETVAPLIENRLRAEKKHFLKKDLIRRLKTEIGLQYSSSATDAE